MVRNPCPSVGCNFREGQGQQRQFFRGLDRLTGFALGWSTLHKGPDIRFSDLHFTTDWITGPETLPYHGGFKFEISAVLPSGEISVRRWIQHGFYDVPLPWLDPTLADVLGLPHPHAIRIRGDLADEL